MQGKPTPDDIAKKTSVKYWPKGLNWWLTRRGTHLLFTVKSKGRTGAAARSKLARLSGLAAPARLYGQ